MHIVPDLKMLEKKYKNELVVIGVHSAKFLSEKDTQNIREAIHRYELDHAVVNDKDFAVWRAYGVDAWPTLFLIDPDGRVVGYKSGEGVNPLFDQTIAKVIKEFDAKGKINRKPLNLVLDRENKPRTLLSYPGKITADVKGGRLFVADTNNNRIVTLTTDGAVDEVIGEGGAGTKDGAFGAAQFFHPRGLSYDPVTNSLYVADSGNHNIRKVNLTAKTVTTIVGTGRQAEWPPRSGTGTTVSLSTPWDLVVQGDKLFVAMAGSHQLWSIDLKTFEAHPYAGGRGENIVDGPLATALLAQPSGISTDGKKLYFADSESSAIRTADIGSPGRVDTIIGTGLFDFGDQDGAPPKVLLQHPLAVVPHEGKLYVADTYNHKLKVIDPATKETKTIAGTGKRGADDGPGGTATLNEPSGLAFVGDRLYIADTNNGLIRIYKLSTGAVSTLKITGMEKLMKTASTEPVGKVRKLPEQTVSGSATSIEVTITLPAGTKLNKDAPFRLNVTSDKPDVVTIPTPTVTKGAVKLTIPITVKPGDANLTLDVNVNYCNVGNEGLCFFKDARLVIPIKVAATGANVVAVEYKP